MSHEIEETDGIIYAGQEPWHGIGYRVPTNTFCASEAILAVPSLAASIEKRPVFFRATDGRLIEVPESCAVVRAHDERCYQIAGRDYGIVMPKDAFRAADALKLRYEVAGTMRDGARFWTLGKFSTVEVLPGDAVDQYLLFWGAHDGTAAIRMLPTTVRVVCANTARMALAEGTNKGAYIRHTRHALERVEDAYEALAFAEQIAAKSVEESRRIAKLIMTPDRWRSLLAAVVPANEKAERQTRTTNIRDQIRELSESGRGTEIPGVRGTGWGALQAVVEWSNYHRSTRGAQDNPAAQAANRFESSLFGASAEAIEVARQTLVQMAA